MIILRFSDSGHNMRTWSMFWLSHDLWSSSGNQSLDYKSTGSMINWISLPILPIQVVILGLYKAVMTWQVFWVETYLGYDVGPGWNTCVMSACMTKLSMIILCRGATCPGWLPPGIILSSRDQFWIGIALPFLPHPSPRMTWNFLGASPLFP